MITKRILTFKVALVKMAEWRVIEQEKRLRDSLLWKLQEAAYAQFGPTAWTQKGVPFYLTSNPLIAKQFALLIRGWLKDCFAAGWINRSHPIYLFDLGAGSGRLAYLILKHLLPLLDSSFSLTYVMTDMVEENLDFWRHHPLLKPYLKEGVLDYALYHHESQEPLVLRYREKSLDSFVNPVCLIGTYFFDTIPQDLFRMKEGKLEEGRISLQIPLKEGSSQQAILEDSLNPEWIMDLQAEYSYFSLNHPETYYRDLSASWLNALLAETAKNVQEGPFLFPAPGLQVIEAFAKRASGRLLLLAADQGAATVEQIRSLGEPKISRHASFSIPVNYLAMANYFRRKGSECKEKDEKHTSAFGKGFLTSFSVSQFVVMAGVMGSGESGKRGGEMFSETERAFLDHIDAFEPVEYWELTGFQDEVVEKLSLRQLMILIKLGNFDPLVLYAFFPVLRGKWKEEREEKKIDCIDQKKMWTRVIRRCWDHFFPVSLSELGFVMNLGVLLFEMQCYKEALFFFQEGEKWMGEEWVRKEDKIKEEERGEELSLKRSLLQNQAHCYRVLENWDEMKRVLERLHFLDRTSS